jgi:serine/threonine-protein kinase RsbW
MIISGSIPSKLEKIPGFISGLLEKIKAFPIGGDDIFDIRISLEEALVNAIKHGNKFDPHLSVEVSLEISDDKVAVKVRDEGKGFDYASLPNPTSAANLDKLSGRGIFLIKSLMNRVTFFDGGRGIKMVKFFKK